MEKAVYNFHCSNNLLGEYFFCLLFILVQAYETILMLKISLCTVSLFPLQLGVSNKAGCEVIVHSVLRVMEMSDGCWMLLLDISNAFEFVDRSAMLEEIRDCSMCCFLN